jgi:hypothetical protein
MINLSSQITHKFFLSILIAFLVLVIWASWYRRGDQEISINSFEECAVHYQVLATIPIQCRTPDGQFFIEYNLNDPRVNIDTDKRWLVRDDNLSVFGKVVGLWFFEASFVIELWDYSGEKIGWGLAQTTDEWMTESLVSFRSEIEVSEDWSGNEAILILIKDNASGLPEHEDALALPIKLKHAI